MANRAKSFIFGINPRTVRPQGAPQDNDLPEGADYPADEVIEQAPDAPALPAVTEPSSPVVDDADYTDYDDAPIASAPTEAPQ